MAQRERPDELFLGVLILHRVDRNGVRGAYSLVTRPAVAHHRNHGTTHSGVASGRCFRDNVREYAVTEYAMTERTVHGLAQTVAIIALNTFLGGFQVVFLGLENEAQPLHGSGGGKVPNGLHVELEVVLGLFTR